MGCIVNPEEQVSRLAAVAARPALTGQAQQRAVRRARRDTHLVVPGRLLRSSLVIPTLHTQRQGTVRAPIDVFQGHVDLCLGVVAALPARPASGLRAEALTAEERGEEVAEIAAAAKALE